MKKFAQIHPGCMWQGQAFATLGGGALVLWAGGQRTEVRTTDNISSSVGLEGAQPDLGAHTLAEEPCTYNALSSSLS